MRPRLVDRYLTRELILPFLWGVGAFSAIMLGIQEIFQLVKLATQGVPLGEIGRLFLLKLPAVVVVTFPMAMLLSTLLVFGRLSADSELVAMLAAGISFGRILVPVLFVSLVVAVLTYQFNERLVPWTYRGAVAMMARLQPGSQNMAVIVPTYSGGKLVQLVSADRFDPVREEMRSVTFIRYRDGRPEAIITAQAASYDSGGNWRFRHGFSYVPQRQGGYANTFDDQRLFIGKAPQEIRARQVKPEEMNFQELQRYIEQQQAEGLPTAQWEVKLYHKLSLPLTSLVFALLGAPLGLRPHRGSSSLGLGLSIIVIFAFYVITAYTHILGGNGVLTPWVAAWVPNTVALGVAGVLLSRAPR